MYVWYWPSKISWPRGNERRQWRHSSMTCSWDARQCIFMPILTFFGEFDPLNVRTPKRHFLVWLHIVWVIMRQNPPTGHFSRRVWEKIKKTRPYISPIWPGAPLSPICTNFGLRVLLVDVINCAKFYLNRLRVWILWGVEVWPLALGCNVAVNTGWD